MLMKYMDLLFVHAKRDFKPHPQYQHIKVFSEIIGRLVVNCIG